MLKCLGRQIVRNSTKALLRLKKLIPEGLSAKEYRTMATGVDDPVLEGLRRPAPPVPKTSARRPVTDHAIVRDGEHHEGGEGAKTRSSLKPLTRRSLVPATKTKSRARRRGKRNPGTFREQSRGPLTKQILGRADLAHLGYDRISVGCTIAGHRNCNKSRPLNWDAAIYGNLVAVFCFGAWLRAGHSMPARLHKGYKPTAREAREFAASYGNPV